jgi:N-acyl-D-amino-acid deacylase
VEIDATGQAIASGFINMLSWATESLLEDGHSQGDLRQGVTLEVMGEGWSMGPLNPVMKADMQRSQRDFKFDVAWTTLDQYLRHLEQRGITPNVASFVGATTVRIHELGYANRPPTPAELERMKALVRQAMEDGALGLGSSLIYAPAFYAATDELIALAQVVAEYDGLYISHMRSEGNRLEESVEELLRIAREANVRAEVYHLKAAGETNWPKMARVLDRIEQARTEGLRITADMYTYPAGATGLDAAMPPWVQEGGYEAWRERLRDPALRARVLREMRTPADDWENLMRAAGPEGTLFIGFRQDSLRRRYIGQTLAQVAAAWGRSPEETALDLVIADSSRVEVVYFLMSEDNIRQQIARPWVSFGSDAESMATDTAFTFLRQSAHPRAYGNFARLLARYVRDERVIPLEEAVRRLTALPAENLRIERRGRLQPGFFADVVVFDPATIQDHATFEQPHQYSTGVQHVWVNGVQVLRDGEHTGAKPGRVVRRAR